VSRWSRYWFATGGRTSAAILRMGIALAVLGTLHHLAHASGWMLESRALYRPVGVWMLLGRLQPPAPLVAALWVLAIGGTAAMLVGAWTRAATAISFGASVALAALSFAKTATWSHQYNVVFLAQLAFLGARGGDVLSIDAWRHGNRDEPRGYQWSVRLVQLAVALMFASAAFHKLAHGHFTLRWALSDNLRHQLLMRYDLADLQRPALVDWLLADVWRYRTAAMLNLISQTAPIFAVLFARRPLVRAAAGSFFIVETLALGFVTALWNLFWLPLVVVFIDWEWLLRQETADAPEVAPPRRRYWFVIAFVVYDAITAFIPTLDQTLNTYPFSGFPMFAVIRARAPYDEHLPYSVAADHFEILSDQPATPDAQRWFDHTNRRLVDALRTPTKLEAPLASLVHDAQARYPQLGIHGARHWLTFFEAPAYPAPARFEPHPIAVTAELRDGTFHSVIGKLAGDGVDLHPVNVDTANVKLLVYRDDDPTPHELPATRSGDHFATGPIDGDLIYVVAVIDGTPWLAASRRLWKWE
jgi:hypothetical protein